MSPLIKFINGLIHRSIVICVSYARPYFACHTSLKLSQLPNSFFVTNTKNSVQCSVNARWALVVDKVTVSVQFHVIRQAYCMTSKFATVTISDCAALLITGCAVAPALC